MKNKVTEGKLIVFSAPSGSGKTTMVRELLKEEKFKLEFSVSATSRKKRPNEIEGKDYYFLSVDEFKQKIKENAFAEWEEVYENQFYGTLKSEIAHIRKKGYNVVFDIDVAGGISIKKLFKDDCLTVFIQPPSISELEKRLRHRGTETTESLKKRLAKAEKEMAYAENFDVTVVNNALEIAVIEVKELVTDFLRI
ncbi:MAG: guanylate kinase [Bacteroidetes bacterium]|nr:MAG: guanylate kinase [Bacteroidota bacterium]